MAPKKKGNKRQEEDWEAEMGEAAPAAANGGEESPAAEESPAGAEEETGGGGGLLAALRKNKNKKAKKGKQANDFVEGEDPSESAAADFSNKQPEEGTFDDEDVFAGKKSAKAGKVTPTAVAEEEDSGFRVKSKKEKEKEKKEREKQRKKEQVRISFFYSYLLCLIYPLPCIRSLTGVFYSCLGCFEEEDCPCRKASACQG